MVSQNVGCTFSYSIRVRKLRSLTEPDVVVAGSADWRECSKREGALDLADRIVQNSLLRKSRKLSLKQKVKEPFTDAIKMQKRNAQST